MGQQSRYNLMTTAPRAILRRTSPAGARTYRVLSVFTVYERDEPLGSGGTGEPVLVFEEVGAELRYAGTAMRQALARKPREPNTGNAVALSQPRARKAGRRG